ncbi:MAG: hypothetical protein HZY75_02015 [Nocardioidaceae bacterium]|nr:MAG: hypothetical protein HZY75_02015 [Nocardioidaceae bacterium]
MGRPLSGRWTEARYAVADLRSLFAFRASALRGRAKTYARVALAVTGAVTLLVAWLPAYLPDGDSRRGEVLLLLPTALLGILLIAVVSAAATGGGRELLPREQAVAYPISPVTDHLGTLVMAPLNIAWILQAWMLLGSVAYVIGPRWGLAVAQVITVLWLIAATCIAQVVAWALEWVRRGPRGILLVRAIAVTVALAVAYLVATHQFVSVLDNLRATLWVAEGILVGAGLVWGRWALTLAGLLALIAIATLVGAYLAGAVSGRQPRDELKLESASYRPRAHPSSEFTALLRADRVSIWRSVPLRRGLMVLGIMPGAVALAGALQWDLMIILPGLVASGGALLFGVNAWCLDARGALWRDSLPVEPRQVYWARASVLAEVLGFATVITLVMGALRAGIPTASELSALVCASLVVIAQVVSRSLRWSVMRPYAMDLRSSRATPAPPVVMVGYSARLALSTTLTAMVFMVTVYGGAWLSIMIALPFLLFSAWRLVQAAELWTDPDVRCRVVSTVAS